MTNDDDANRVRAGAKNVVLSAASAAAAASPLGEEAAAVAGGLAASAATGVEFFDFLVALIRGQKTMTGRFEDAGNKVFEGHLESDRPQLETSMRALVAKLGELDAARCLPPNLEACRKAYDTAGEPKKARLISAALAPSLDPAFLLRGNTIRVFEILRQLDYGDVRFLATEYEESGGLRAWREERARAQEASFVPSTLDYNFSVAWAGATSEVHERLLRLREHRLVHWSERDQIAHTRITWLGKEVLRVCRNWRWDEREGQDEEE